MHTQERKNFILWSRSWRKNMEVASYFVSQDGEQEMEQLQSSPGPVLWVASVPANCSGNTAEMFPPQLFPDQMTQLYSHRSWGTQKDSFCLSFSDPAQRRESGKQRENPPSPSEDLVRFDVLRSWDFSTVSLYVNWPFKFCFCKMWMATFALFVPSFGLNPST